MLISVSQGRVVRAVCVITWRGAGAATHRAVRAEVLATHHLVAHEGREGVQTLPGAARGVRGLGEGVQERCNRGQAASLLRGHTHKFRMMFSSVVLVSAVRAAAGVTFEHVYQGAASWAC